MNSYQKLKAKNEELRRDIRLLIEGHPFQKELIRSKYIVEYAFEKVSSFGDNNTYPVNGILNSFFPEDQKCKIVPEEICNHSEVLLSDPSKCKSCGKVFGSPFYVNKETMKSVLEDQKCKDDASRPYCHTVTLSNQNRLNDKYLQEQIKILRNPSKILIQSPEWKGVQIKEKEIIDLFKKLYPFSYLYELYKDDSDAIRKAVKKILVDRFKSIKFEEIEIDNLSTEVGSLIWKVDFSIVRNGK